VGLNFFIMPQETAVDWLFNWMSSNQYFIGNDLLKAVEEAKAIEKEQIIEAYNKGNMGSELANIYAEKYYIKTYKK
jgi:hypothetical protein